MEIEKLKNVSHQSYTCDDFLSTLFFNKRIPLVVTGISDEKAESVKSKILDCYGDVEICAHTESGDIHILASKLPQNAEWILIDGGKVVDAKRFDFSDFVQIMKRLRAKDGCEWDRAQTHESIRINLIEEAYELVEGIDAKSADMMREECGDVLMQAVFHTQIAEENGEFGYGDMFTELCRKLIDRHTHIFGENHANNPEEALKFWNEAKKKEKKYTSTGDAMERVPKNLPALLYAEKVQKLAKKVGFDWSTPEPACDKLLEELKELKDAEEKDRAEEAGDLLFAAVNVVRLFKIEPEIALRDASAKFLRRFEKVENEVARQGKEMTDLTLAELDAIWEQVKQQK